MAKNETELHDEWQTKAEQFSKDFANATYEMGLAQTFIRELCDIYGVGWRRLKFEDRVSRAEGCGINRIDCFLPELLLVEMKSAGHDLEEAYGQALGYIERLREEVERGKREATDIPRYLLISDFRQLHLYDRNRPEPSPDTIELADLRNHVKKFSFLCGYDRKAEERQEKANVKAAEKLADLHDTIKKTGYGGKELETLLTRILFCFFAEDTGLFGVPKQFTNLVKSTREDGRDLAGELDMLFNSLNTKKRPAALYGDLLDFPYVNGKLFEERLPFCFFDKDSRKALLAASEAVDWSEISPDIFGSLFQFIMHFDEGDESAKSKKRREFGAHYTSEANILKTIGPLFLDKLKKELSNSKGDAKKIDAFLAKIGSLRFLDPACGCGNFLVVAYREIRMLEETALDEAKKFPWGSLGLPMCNVNQFYGIEIDPAAAEIATLALWLTDHQMNMRTKLADGKPYVRLPLTERANIVCGNALQLDWETLLPAKNCNYILGNPPFVGYSHQSKEQKNDLALVFGGMDGSGVLDYVAAWYVKAAKYIKKNRAILAAFVSTNSITQGEQVGVLWKWMVDQGMNIHFAHRTFRWSNEGQGVAAVHCVIVGFGSSPPKGRVIFDYPKVNGPPRAIKAKNINPYLVDAPTVFIEKRRKPICENAPDMVYGSKPTDGGNLLLSQEEADAVRGADGVAAKYIRRFLNADEFINDVPRYCLWLVDSTEDERNLSKVLQERTEKVKAMRLASPKIPTQKLAETPHLFGEIRQTKEPYLLIPSVSSEQRQYIPIGYLPPSVVASNANFMLPNAALYHFGVITSTMHNAWMRTVCGRLKSDYRYSNTIVYNNFPWPENASEEQKQAIEAAGQQVLDARENHPGKSLADLYNPETMPDDLQDAHTELDAAVDAAYGYNAAHDDAARVAFLFAMYAKLTAGTGSFTQN